MTPGPIRPMPQEKKDFASGTHQGPGDSETNQTLIASNGNCFIMPPAISW